MHLFLVLLVFFRFFLKLKKIFLNFFFQRLVNYRLQFKLSNITYINKKFRGGIEDGKF